MGHDMHREKFMSLPKITHLQAVVLSSLKGHPERYGHNLRQELYELTKRKKSLPAFYQMMARLENDGLVAGKKEVRRLDEATVTVSVYRITKKGERELKTTLGFYEWLGKYKGTSDGR